MMALALNCGLCRFSNGSRTTNIDAEVGRVGRQHQRHARNRDRVGHARRFASDLFDLGDSRLGALQRSRVGQLNVDDEPALVLLGNEAGRARSKTQ